MFDLFSSRQRPGNEVKCYCAYAGKHNNSLRILSGSIVTGNRDVDILLITALREELEVLLAHFPEQETVPSSESSQTYYLGSLKTEEEGVFYSYALTCLFQMGNSDAAIATANAIRDLQPQFVFMFGIAAGVEGRANLGDIIVPTEIFYYEQAKIMAGKTEMRLQSYQVDSLLRSRLANFVVNYKVGKDHQVAFGPFAVGEKVISDQASIESLKGFAPKLLGIEMESYGVAKAVASSLSKPRFIAVRGVSDFANENKNDQWRDKALSNAAAFLLSFLGRGELPVSERRENTTKKTLIAIHHLSINQRASITSKPIATLEQYEIKELLIDQTDLFRNGQLLDPREAVNRQDVLIPRLNSLLSTYPLASLGYFGLAHIPLMFYASSQINRQVVNVYSTDRQSGKWLALEEKGKGPKLSIRTYRAAHLSGQTDIAILISVSARIAEDLVEDITARCAAHFHLSLKNPSLDIVTSEEQINIYALLFLKVLADIKKSYPLTERIHLFIAAPPPLVFRLGQQVSKMIDPTILVYNYSQRDDPKYGWALNIMTGEIIDRRSL